MNLRNTARTVRWRIRRARGIYRKEHRLRPVFDALKHDGGTAIGYPLELMQACDDGEADFMLWAAWVKEKRRQGWDWKAAHVEAIRLVAARQGFCVYVQREQGLPAPIPIIRCSGPLQHEGRHSGGMAERNDLPWRTLTDLSDTVAAIGDRHSIAAMARSNFMSYFGHPFRAPQFSPRDDEDPHDSRVFHYLPSDGDPHGRVVTAVDPAAGDDCAVAVTIRREMSCGFTILGADELPLSPEAHARVGAAARRYIEAEERRVLTNLSVNHLPERRLGPRINWGEDGAAPAEDIRMQAARFANASITPLGREVVRMAEAGESLGSINSFLGEILCPAGSNHLPAEGFVRDERAACWRRDPPSPPSLVQDIEIATLRPPVDATHPITFERIMAQRAEHTRNRLDLGTPFVEFASRLPGGGFGPYRAIGTVESNGECETDPARRRVLNGETPGLSDEYRGGGYAEECDRRNPDLRGDDEMIDGLLEDVAGGLEQLRQISSGETEGDS